MLSRALSTLNFALLLFALLIVSFSCSKEKPGPVYRVIGEAFVGPSELPIRADLSLRSEVVTTAKHDEKLEILDRRRRFVQVRTSSNVVGWVDSRLLISAKQRADLADLAALEKDAPSMGRATVYDDLNVHTDPNRYSPTFHVIREKEQIDIIGHRVVPRVPFAGQKLEIEEDTPQIPVKKKRPKKEAAVPPPPAPPAPGLPENWLELSRPPVYEVVEVNEAAKGNLKKNKRSATAAPGGLAMDDLSLIRTKEGRVGWVVSSALFLQVPDEVAQYAEGNKITSYFAVGEVRFEAETKKHWLWTTQSQKYAPFDFDGFRVFTFNSRRGRYETAYRERELRGFFPVLVKVAGNEAEFSLVSEGEDGKLWQKKYFFNGTRVSFKGKTPYIPSEKSIAAGAGAMQGATPIPKTSGWWDELRKMLPGGK